MNVRLLFKIFYTSFFTLLSIVLLALLLITPADAIRQALENNQIYNVFVIAGCYFFTVVIGILIYASRLYTNKTVLAAIPKTWIPVEKGEVSNNVRKMIVASLTRSAVIAWDSRPRADSEPPTVISDPEARDVVVRPPEAEDEDKEQRDFFHRHSIQLKKEDPTVTIPPPKPVWGDIAHNGWASPLSPDLPNLQYTTVVLELAHLIEAKAVSLAPADPESSTEPPLPDIRAVDLLQRPAAMGLRDYIGHLMAVGVVTSPQLANDFLSAYEYARFGGQPLSEAQFRELMKLFAELLRTMTALSPAAIDTDTYEESDIDDDASSSSTPRSRSLASFHHSDRVSSRSRSGSEATIHTAPSRRPATLASSRQRGSAFSTAPATPRSRRRERVVSRSRSDSVNSFAQSRAPYDPGNISGSSSSTSLSVRSSVSQGSVIRLSRTSGSGDGELPYVLDIPGQR